VFLFRRAGQAFESLRVTARGRRRSEHPTVFTDIRLEFAVRGSLTLAAAEAAVKEAEERFCPVWAMLRFATSIEASVRVEGWKEAEWSPTRAT